MNPDRRQFLRSMGIVAAGAAGADRLLSPREARAEALAPKVLSVAERATLEAVGDVLLPGAAEAGIGWFIDEQLAKDPNESLLMARYLHVPPPFAGFYKGAAAAIDAFAKARHDSVFTRLDGTARDALVGSLFPEQPEDWRGPPSQPVFLCLRSDAIDVVYGTMEGFAALGVSYVAHIEPPSKW